MLVKEIFEPLYNNSITKLNPIWEYEYGYDDSNTLQLIEILFQCELKELFENKNSEDVVKIIHLHFDQITEIKEKTKVNSEKEILSFLRFIWGLSAVTQLNMNGEFIYCYEIFMKSVFDKSYKNGETYDLQDMSIYNYLSISQERTSNGVIEQWFSQLYYYSKSFSGLNEWCEFFFPIIRYNLSKEIQIESYHPQFLSNLLTWCEVNFNSEWVNDIGNIIKREYYSIEWISEEKKDIKSLLGLSLLLSTQYNNSDKKSLFSELESHTNISPLHRMQGILATSVDLSSITSNYPSLIDSIKCFNEFLNEHYPDVIDQVYQRARLFNCLNSIIVSTSEIGHGEFLDNLLSAFYNVDKPQTKGSTLYIIPNLLKRIDYCLGNQTISENKDTQSLIVKIVEFENKSFNTYRILKGGKKQEIAATNQPTGFPVPIHGMKYESALLELYDFNVIKDEIKDLESLCQFDLNSVPIQSLMIRSISETLPINLSLSKKVEYSEVEKVLFWSGNSFTSEIELNALQEVFESKDIIFEIHSNETSSLSDYLTRITEIDPDIIWISSHGEHHHYDPNVSKIIFSESESIGIRDFGLLTNQANKRRLIFLNICEGGIHSQTGEFKNLGFPNLLTSSNQDVISHLWMAESNFSYVFAVFIALGISYLDKNYFESFQYSLATVTSNKETILEELDKFDLDLSDLKERIRNNNNTEWENIITSGSPVYNI